jgi:Rrf2 family transcriptional regulator, cysteine metabolism repressor
MRLNTKVRYGTRAMLELALHYDEGLLSLAQVAAAQEISEKYLELVFATLRAAGLVHSQRGARGGYTLARPPEQITLREIFDVLESPEPYVPCTADHDACHRWARCATQEVWAQMYDASMQVLQAVTLADLVARHTQRCAPVLSYSI